MLAPSAMKPLLLACSVKRPVAVIGALTVMLPASVRLNAAPVDAPVTNAVAESVRVTLPVVFAIRFSEPNVAVVPKVIAPDPDERVVVPAVLRVPPAVCDIVP